MKSKMPEFKDFEELISLEGDNLNELNAQVDNQGT
jgi:hypothetical protein